MLSCCRVSSQNSTVQQRNGGLGEEENIRNFQYDDTPLREALLRDHADIVRILPTSMQKAANPFYPYEQFHSTYENVLLRNKLKLTLKRNHQHKR